MSVTRVLHDSSEDVFAGDVGVKSADDDRGNDNERKGALLHVWFLQRAYERRGRVLTVVGISVEYRVSAFLVSGIAPTYPTTAATVKMTTSATVSTARALGKSSV